MSRFVHVIWCDDIRQEVGNKPSFMGVYTGGLIAEKLPSILPRLAAWVHVSSDIENPIKRASVSLERDDGTVLISVPETELATPTEEVLAGKTLSASIFGLQIAPLPLVETCKFLQVVVKTEDDVLHGNKLWIYTPANAPSLAPKSAEKRDSAIPKPKASGAVKAPHRPRS